MIQLPTPHIEHMLTIVTVLALYLRLWAAIGCTGYRDMYDNKGRCEIEPPGRARVRRTRVFWGRAGL